ncbi:MAG: DUF1351 domain-containing protein [Elusimicrobiota bacterium]|jgi:hypothetical protein|nr:DUF1351 domain-containing protein [Elusimicrobiota bacterium]
MELKIKEFSVIDAINFNFDELKKELEGKLEKYKNLIYDEKEIKIAKDDVATLRKLVKMINDKKIEIKKQYLEPYEKFENKIKELLEMIDEPIILIDTKIKETENKQKEKKREDIERIYNKEAGGLEVKIEQIFNERWLNKTYSIDDIKAEIIDKVVKIEKDLKLIKEMRLEATLEAQLLDIYIKKLDINYVMNEKLEIERRKEEIEKQKKEIERKREIESEAKEGIEPSEKEIAEEAKKEGLIYTIDFRVWANREQLEKLKIFLKENKIKYEKVK